MNWPVILRRYHLIAAVVWALLIPIAFWVGFAQSVPFVTAISLWALTITEVSCWQASRAEVASIENPPQDTPSYEE